MFKRLKKMYQLSKKDPKALAALESLTPSQLAAVPIEQVEGDGKAVFFGEGTTEEFEEQKKEDNGLAAWYRRLRNL